MNDSLAPIVLFCYKRLKHTKDTVEALQNNYLSNESILYIYSDGYKSLDDKDEVKEVRDYLKTITGFKEIHIFEQKENKGLANSIIEGVTSIINKHGKIIVVEDDIVTSKSFLKFINSALDYYENTDKVWHISGWSYPIEENGLDDIFFWQMMNCWGWATWKDKWSHFEKNIQKNIAEFPLERINEFNLGGALNNWDELIQNLPGYKYNTWAIFWHLAIFKNNGFCLNPKISFVKNIGFDNTGENTDIRDDFHIENLNTNQNINFTTPNKLEVNELALKRVQNFFINRNKKLINNTNNNLSFSILFNKLKTQINELDKNCNYIIYGAGLISEFISNNLKDKINYIVDRDENKCGTNLNGLIIKDINELKFTNDKIIISVLGREKEIIDYLIKKFHLKKTNIITFSL